MSILQWLTGQQTVRDVGLSFYKSALTKARKHDQQGAMDDYTTAIDLHDAPADVRATALYNRALLHVAAKNIPKAIEDLSAVLAMAAPLHNIKSAARQKLDRMQHSHPTNAAARGIAGTLTTLGMQHSHLTNATSRPNVATAT